MHFLQAILLRQLKVKLFSIAFFPMLESFFV